MSTVLTCAQWQLLIALCFLAGKHPLAIAEKLIHGLASPSEIDELCELISNEFMMSGIEESFEPNSYGLELESLLDAVNSRRGQRFSNL